MHTMQGSSGDAAGSDVPGRRRKRRCTPRAGGGGGAGIEPWVKPFAAPGRSHRGATLVPHPGFLDPAALSPGWRERWPLLTEKSLVRAEERRWLGDARFGRASRGRNQLTWPNDESDALGVRGQVPNSSPEPSRDSLSWDRSPWLDVFGGGGHRRATAAGQDHLSVPRLAGCLP